MSRHCTSTYVMTIAAVLLINVIAVGRVDTIRCYQVGSSSFSDELMLTVKDIVEASGDYAVLYDAAGYTRLDDFARGTASYDSWLAENMPRIQSGNYDYVISQTINFAYLNPAEHDT
ncbi:MAG: hypothetical protein GF331_09155, partial [Chitinivibrionales bacterium]|nr:hypothetical protein [Chitinivibrionales bacterium]